MMRADVVVVGLGSMGAAAAYQLAARGVRVVGMDRFAPPHEHGAHAGGSRIIRMAYMEGADYVPLLQRAYDLWHDLESASGQTLLTQTGGLMLGAPDSTVVAGAVASARTHSLAYELLDAAEIRRRFPAFAPNDDEVGCYEEVAGLVRPEVTIQVLHRLAREAGADLRFGVSVDDWRATSDSVVVSCADGPVRADRLILAPGAWAPELIRIPLSFRVQRRVQHYWHPAHFDDFEIGRCPVWMWERAPGKATYGMPAMDGAVKVARHYGDEAVDPWVGAAPVRAEEAAELREWLSSRLPGLADAGWAGAKPCLYTLTPDEHFVVGTHPHHDNVVVAGGFSGHGFKFVPVMGEILADLAITGQTQHSIALFEPSRFGSVPDANSPANS